MSKQASEQKMLDHVGAMEHRAVSGVLGPPRDPVIADWYQQLLGGPAGVAVTEKTALTLSAVWRAVSLLSGSIGGLGVDFLKKRAGNETNNPDHPLWQCFNETPDDEIDSLSYLETSQAHLLTWGNAYAEKRRNMGGDIVKLDLLTPDRVNPRRTEK